MSTKKLLYFVLLFIGATALTSCVTTSENATLERDDAEAAQANLDLGINYLKQGNLDQARIKLERSIEAESKSPTAHRLLGLVYEQLGDMDSARKHYYTAVRQGPKDPDALNQLGIFVCTYSENKAEALEYFDRALAIPLYQQRFLLFTNAGTCAKNIDLFRAENYLREGLALNPNYPDALLQLGDVAYSRGNYLQSRAFIQRFFAAANPNSQALWLGYRVEYALGDRATAGGYAEQLLRDFPESVETRLLLELQQNAG